MTTPTISPDDIRTTVRSFVARITEREPDEITDTTDFQKDLDIDSLMAMEMMVSVNKKYRIEIMDQEFAGIHNVNDAVTVVQRHLATRH
jgi:acyl carrier protein